MINEAKAKEKGLEVMRQVRDGKLTPEEGMTACEEIAKDIKVEE